MMNWVFGSTKKKDPPPVTVDPTPIENGFYCVQNMIQSQPSPQPLYPSLNPQPLPYALSPNLPTAATPTGSVISPSRQVTPSRAIAVEVTNQLESIPFRIAPRLQADASIINDDNGISLNEFTRNLNKVKEFFNSEDFNYDFELERRIIREAKMINGHVAY